jgi:hypothetical protein
MTDPIGIVVDVCGYDYTIVRKRDERTGYQAATFVAYRQRDDGEKHYAVIQRRTVNKERRWAVIGQLPKEKS